MNNLNDQEMNTDIAKDRLLVAEDDKDLRRILKVHLESRGFMVTTARNGKIALEKINEEKPDCLILDVMMPVMDGFEVCKRIKTMNSTKDIPVIFLTAKGKTEDKLEGMGFNADDYITKPFDFSELIARIKLHISRKESRKLDIERAETRSSKEIVAELTEKTGVPIGKLKRDLGELMELVRGNPGMEEKVRECERDRRELRQIFIDINSELNPFYEPDPEEELIEI
ncbi:MAG: response regulator [Candidatus Latescibacteria bacterium]|nr:response regulator [bacterium]MBD3424886.1 response regulator [Candidatus Latescibacterota bacterium]